MARSLQSVVKSADHSNTPWWRSGRVIGGSVLLVVSAVLGAALLSPAHTYRVWAAARDLPAGTVLTANDVVATKVLSVGPYASVAAPIAGEQLTHALARGEFVATSATTSQRSTDLRAMAVAVDADHAPARLIAGDRVDVWVSPKDVSGALGSPFLLLAGVPVESVVRDSSTEAISSVVLTVRPSAARALVQGVRQGAIDLVRVTDGVS